MAWLTDIRTTTIAALVGVAAGGVEDSRVRPFAFGGAGDATTADTFPRLVVGCRRFRREPRGNTGRMDLTAEIVIQCITVGPPGEVAGAVAACETLEEQVHAALVNDGAWLTLWKGFPAPRVLSSDVDVTIVGSTAVCSIVQTWEVRGEYTRPAGRGDDLSTIVSTLTSTPKPAVVATVDGLDA